MRIALIVALILGLITAIWTTELTVWGFVAMAAVSVLELCWRRKRSDMAALVSSTLLIFCGFSALHSGIVTMSDVSVSARLTTLILPLLLIFFATLLLCMGLVERSSRVNIPAQRALRAEDVARNQLRRRWL